MDIYPITFYQDNRFYVYMYLRSKKSQNGDIGSPYYIGKGSGNRAFIKHQKGISIPNDISKIEFIYELMTERDAFELEKYQRIK